MLIPAAHDLDTCLRPLALEGRPGIGPGHHRHVAARPAEELHHRDAQRRGDPLHRGDGGRSLTVLHLGEKAGGEPGPLRERAKGELLALAQLAHGDAEAGFDHEGPMERRGVK